MANSKTSATASAAAATATATATATAASIPLRVADIKTPALGEHDISFEHVYPVDTATKEGRDTFTILMAMTLDRRAMQSGAAAQATADEVLRYAINSIGLACSVSCMQNSAVFRDSDQHLYTRGEVVFRWPHMTMNHPWGEATHVLARLINIGLAATARVLLEQMVKLWGKESQQWYMPLPEPPAPPSQHGGDDDGPFMPRLVTYIRSVVDLHTSAAWCYPFVAQVALLARIVCHPSSGASATWQMCNVRKGEMVPEARDYVARLTPENTHPLVMICGALADVIRVISDIPNASDVNWTEQHVHQLMSAHYRVFANSCILKPKILSEYRRLQLREIRICVMFIAYYAAACYYRRKKRYTVALWFSLRFPYGWAPALHADITKESAQYHIATAGSVVAKSGAAVAAAGAATTASGSDTEFPPEPPEFVSEFPTLSRCRKVDTAWQYPACVRRIYQEPPCVGALPGFHLQTARAERPRPPSLATLMASLAKK